MKYTLFILASLMIILAIPTIAGAQTNIPDMKRDATTTYEKTDGNPEINQTIAPDDYIIEDTPDLVEPSDENVTFTQGAVTSGNVENYIDMDALEERSKANTGKE